MDTQRYMDVSMIFFLLAFTLLCGIVMGFGAWFTRDIEAGLSPTKGIRYQPVPGMQYSMFAPVFLCVLSLFGWRLFLAFLPPFLFVCLYDCVLLLLLPLLRKFISAKVCGWLWALPYMPLYFCTTGYRWIYSPLWVIPTQLRITSAPEILVMVWVSGTVLIVLWHLISHFMFKSSLLKHAYPTTDGKIIETWAREQALANFPGDSFKLRVSTRTQTPLSIGLFRRTTYVILPEREYTPEELTLIFRHELIHIGRKDSVNKFFMLLISALFWFNPLMWIAMRCSADDLELSCDETVLLGCDQQTRHQYADLLLSTAADQRGFTTCLSTSARALRYRLKNAITPRKRLMGGILVGVLFVVLSIGMLFGDFSYNPGTTAERIFDNQNPGDYVCEEAVVYDGEDSKDCTDVDTEALMEYLLKLPVARLMRHYENMGLGRGTQLIVQTQEDRYVLWLSDRYLRVITHADGKSTVSCYILRKSVDWDYLTQLLQAT